MYVNRDPSKFAAPCGFRLRVKHKLVIDPDGNRFLEESGVEDQYERIQSFKEACTIENIVSRALNGDPSALAKRQGVYIDTTLLPTDLISANEAVKRAEAIYKGLSAKQREEYGSFRDFIGKFGTLKGIQSVLNPKSENVAKEETPNEPQQ